MKNLLSLFVFTFVLLCGLQTAQAQTRLGGGLAFGTDADAIGLTAKAQFDVNDKWRVSPSFTYYFVDLIDFYEINADAHYMLTEGGASPSFYAIGGLNMSFVSFSLSAFGVNVSETASEFNINLGAGANLELTDSLMGYGEVKYALGGASQLVLNAGVLFSL